MPISNVKFLPDYAGRKSGEQKFLEKVGIEDVDVYRIDFDSHSVLTSQSAFISISETNGAHMSRLVEVLMGCTDDLIEPDRNLLDELSASHDIDNAYWECKWKDMFPVSSSQSMTVTLKMEGVKIKEGIYEWYLTYVIPYASVCPCSAEMCGMMGGIPHMQRAVAEITGRINGGKIELEELASITVEKVAEAVTLVPIPLLKRDGELEWCQRASTKHLFVEDAARAIGKAIDEWYEDYVVVCKHFESIHQHNVVAVCRKGRKLL